MRTPALCSLALSLWFAVAPAGRAELSRVDSFARLPVLEAGRVMPMDTLARLRLLQFSGHSSLNGRPALHWIARLVFTPEVCHNDKIFLVNNPEVIEAMGLKAGDGRRYSFRDLEPGLSNLNDRVTAALKVDEKEHSPVEKEILRLYQNLNNYIELFHSFSFAFPDPAFSVTSSVLRARFDLPANLEQFSYFDIFKRAGLFVSDIEAVGKLEPSAWSEDQRTVFGLSANLYQWSKFYRGLPLPMVPMDGHQGDQWLSPWDILGIGKIGETLQSDIGNLQDMARAYADDRQADFDAAAKTFEQSIMKRAPQSRSLSHLNLELLYNRVDPFYRAELFYGFAFLAALLFMLGDRAWIRRAGFLLVFLALIPHTWGLVARMLMMGRPPVTNLYATFIFVGWICAVLGLILDAIQRNGFGVLLAGFSGLALLLISGRFSSQGDTMGVMIAVLDSNFWLTTHVVAITVGYAGCVAAGLAGHLYLIKSLRHRLDSPDMQAALRAVYGLLAFGLIFSFLGTMLGGVWADQSWGRFWGWDPKENGALLIVLWSALLFHARIDKLIGPIGFAAGSVLGVIVVLMAWLGINLLGVGLHSYGFTSGVARGFWIAVLAELLFVAVFAPLAWLRSRRLTAPAA